MNAVAPAVASPTSSATAGKTGGDGTSAPEANATQPADFAALLSAQLLPSEEIAALTGDPLGEDDAALASEEPGDQSSSAPLLLGGSLEAPLALRTDAGFVLPVPATQVAGGQSDDAAFGWREETALGGVASDDTNKQLKELASGLENLLARKEARSDPTTADKAATPELAGIVSTHAVEPARKPEGVPGTATIGAPLHSAQWSDDFSQKLVWMAKNDLQSAQLSINPSNLGPIEVTLSIGKDSASAHFASPFPEVRAALESALPRLKEMLAEAGVALSQADVGAQSQQRFGDGQAQRQSAQASAGGWLPTFPAADAVIEAQAPRIARGIGMVDTFA